MADDAALLRRYRNGEAAAFTQLYERHRLGLFRFLLGLCGDHALAEEVFQDTWMSLIRSASEQREAVLFKTWLYQIARNRLIDHWRKSGRHQGKLAEYDEAQHASADPGPGPEQQLPGQHHQRTLKQRMHVACRPPQAKMRVNRQTDIHQQGDQQSALVGPDMPEKIIQT